MKLGKTIGGAAVLFGVAAALAAPASAAPQPGDRCGSNDSLSADGTLWCNHQSMMWMNKNMAHNVKPGQACDTPGAVTYTPPEDPVVCRSGTWQLWSR